MTARQVFYEGRVQGVGFRYTVRQIAKGFDVVGSVKNLEDGRVELQVGGAAPEVADFLQAIIDSELGAFIKKMREHEIPPFATPRGFEIVH